MNTNEVSSYGDIPAVTTESPTVARKMDRLYAPPALSERLIRAFLWFCAALSIGTTLGIIGVLFEETRAFFAQVPFSSFFGDTQWTPLFAEKHFGIWPLVGGTLLTTAIAMAVALPFGLTAAIYLSEFASATVRKWLKPALEILAGVPTVVYGYFALTMVTPVLQALLPDLAAFNVLSAGLMMGIMILPVVASLSEDAIFAVPSSLREGALALGATKLSTVFRVVLPSAFSGIGAATILGVSRAIGETMIVAIAAGQQARLSLDPREGMQTMTAYIVQVSMGDTPTGTIEFHTIFAVGMMLFCMTMVLNLIAQQLRGRVLKGSV